MEQKNIAITSDKVLLRQECDLYDGWLPCSDTTRICAYADPDKEAKEGITRWKANKIPAELIKKVLGTLAMYEHMETGYVLYRDPIHKVWDIRCPAQKGTAVHVNFFEEEHEDPAFQVIGTIHIHPQMGAFWSGTDLADQTKKPGSIHMVFGTSGRHVNKTLCTVFEKGAYYNIPFETLCEEVDFTQDYPAVDEWCKIIDKQDWVDPTAPAVSPAVYYPTQYGGTAGAWYNPSYYGSTPTRKTYAKYGDADDPGYGRYSQGEAKYDWYDCALPEDEPKCAQTADRGLAKALGKSAAAEKYDDIMGAAKSVVKCAVDMFGVDAVLAELSEVVGDEVCCLAPGEPGAENSTLQEDSDDLMHRMLVNISEKKDDYMDVIQDMLDFARVHSTQQLLDAADEAMFDEDDPEYPYSPDDDDEDGEGPRWNSPRK